MSAYLAIELLETEHFYYYTSCFFMISLQFIILSSSYSGLQAGISHNASLIHMYESVSEADPVASEI